MNLVALEGIVVAATLGLAAGVGGYTFIYAKGASYLTDDPQACANCHVMREHYDGWVKSTHRAVAVCNDCHTPPGVVAKYASKAANGFWHSFAFTTGRFPDPLQIKPHNLAITENACRTCHQPVVTAIEGSHPRHGQLSCIRCHGAVGHL
ncbi:MAG: cytochrome c nitrite reductase small subunit [Thermodesulfobacteriota bacterium]|jgi:cytochrome c nitrite reductase small subunit